MKEVYINSVSFTITYQLYGFSTLHHDLILTKFLENVGGSLWTSLTDLFVYQRFLWESTGETFAYQNFYEGAPNNFPVKTCISMGSHLPLNNTRYWFNNECFYDHRYICERRRDTCKTV